MGRAARNAGAVKTRQPLAEVAVFMPDGDREALLALQDTVLDELNVKSLRMADSAEELFDLRVKPNLRVLGPRLGKRLPQVTAALAQADAAALVAQARADGAVVLRPDDGEPLMLSLEDLLIETVDPDGYQVEQDGGWAVALRTAIDQDLRDEGLVRELVHAVQLSHKNADLRIEDTIDLALTLPATLADLAERHADYIRRETLASALSLDGGGREHTETARVEGEEVVISITATGTIFTESYG